MPTSTLPCLFYPAGSPGSPRDVSVSKSASELTLRWTEGSVGRTPTTGYVIEVRPSGKEGVGHLPRSLFSLAEARVRALWPPLGLSLKMWRPRGRLEEGRGTCLPPP